MLIITRRPGEKIIVGEDVTIHVMEVSGNQVRIGIQAPRSIPVYREEIWDSVRKAAKTSAKAPDDRGS